MSACLLAALALALAVAGCGGAGRRSDDSGGRHGTASLVEVYSSLPLRGPAGAHGRAILGGIRLALQQAGGRAGQYTVSLRSLDDSEPAAGAFGRARVTANARTAAADTRTDLYIGDFDSQASATSIPILNEAGVAQISPGSTYAGLTVAARGTRTGEPQEYYPGGRRTFFRVVPRDAMQAVAGLATMKRDGCTRVAVANDERPYGSGLAATLELDRSRYGVDIVADTGIPSRARLHAYAQSLKRLGVDCFYFAGIASPRAVQIAKGVNAELPKARIVGGDGICTRSYTNPADGGVPATVARRIECTMVVQSVASYPGGRRFLFAYRARYGAGDPDPYAIYGYEAMKLALDTIASLGARGNDKAAVLAALRSTRSRQSVLGSYGFDANGDTTLRAVGLYRVDGSGSLRFERAVG
ncbi:MAG: branched-chain amino acid ABC transporter substrate-binding protein [Actinomycetota bacterium]|nr:branched-chain amino acid ABC transporter substrate-binding protein [Actinomycetota bacterium]